MRISRVKAKLARNEPALVVCLHFADPSLFELASLMGFDCLWIDLEHHSHSQETANHLMRAARVGTADILARPAKGEYMRMCRLLEAGAQGILYPRCDDAAEAAEVVKWAKFAPMGRRGVDGANPDMPYCTQPLVPYLKAANEETFVVIQLEDAGAVANADAIAAVPGVDVLFIGQGDFSIIEGVPGQFDHPKVVEAVKRTAAAAQRHGKHWGTTSSSPEDSKRLMDLGARFICHGADILIIKNGLEAIQHKYAALGFTFDNRLTLPTGKG